MSWKSSRRKQAEVSISQCVHYCGFRYGHDEYHPYESYVARLHRREPTDEIRREFIDFLLHYRPRNLGEALGIELSRPYPLWLYPWAHFWDFFRARRSAGWFQDPFRIPDIITHFSDAGIPNSLIEKEYGWLHGAYEALAREGYHPEKFGYPLARMLEGGDGRKAYLMLDGNHRVSALSALGHRSLVLEFLPNQAVALGDVKKWRGVRNGFFSEEDAIKVFNAYFTGNPNYRTPESDIPVIVK